MKKILVFLLIVVATVSMFVLGTGCKTVGTTETTAAAATTAAAETTAASATTAAAETTAAKTLVIGRVFYVISGDPYQTADSRHFQDYADELGVKVILLDGKGTGEGQLACVQDLIAKHVDGIIVQATDSGLADTFIQLARKAKIPILTWYTMPNTELAPHMRVLEYDVVFSMGVAQAKKWIEFYPDKKMKLAVFDVPEIDWMRANRTQAWIDGVLSVAPDAEVIGKLDTKNSREGSFSVGQDILQAHPEVNNLYGVNATTTMGGLAAFETAGRGKMVNGKPVTELFASTDGSEEEIMKIVDPSSSLKYSEVVTPIGFAKQTMDVMLKVIKGETPADKQTIFDMQPKLLDGFNMNIDDLQKTLDDFYSTVNLKEKLKEMQK